MTEAEYEGPQQVRQQIDDMLHRLGEHFEAVHVFVSRRRPDGETESFSRGVGNWNTRWGQIERWVEHCKSYDDEESRMSARPKEGDSESE